MVPRRCPRRAFALALLWAAALPLAAAGQALAAPAGAEWPPRSDWNQMRIEVDGVSLVLARPQVQRLAELIGQAVAAPTLAAAATGPAIAQFEIGQGTETLGVLSLHGDRWHWAASADRRGGRTLKVDAALSHALLQEAQRLLQR